MSLHLAKVKALRRRDAAKNGSEEPDFTGRLWQNFTYEALALGLFVIGVMVGLLALNRLTIPPA